MPLRQFSTVNDCSLCVYVCVYVYVCLCVCVRERESATEREGEPVCVYSSQPVTLKGKIYYKASVNKCKAQVDCTVLKMSDKLLEKEVFLDSYIF